jgi:Tol biopolymer transport system component
VYTICHSSGAGGNPVSEKRKADISKPDPKFSKGNENMKTKKTAVIYAVIILAQLFLVGNFAMSEEYYLLATVSYNEIGAFNLHDNVFKLHKKIKFPKICNFHWPNFNRVTHDLYFEGIREDDIYRENFIYKCNPDSNPKAEQLLKGRYPALSPDGKWLTYYLHPNKLELFNLENKQTKEITNDMYNRQPPVWISNNRMLYYSINKQLILLNILTGEKRMTGYEKIIPGSLSPDGKKVLCGTYDGTKIILYSIDDNKIETVKESKFLTIGTIFIWRHDGKSFLYWRRTWSEQLKFREGGSLFLFSLKDKTEKDLNPGLDIIGGVVGDFEKWK